MKIIIQMTVAWGSDRCAVAQVRLLSPRILVFFAGDVFSGKIRSPFSNLLFILLVCNLGLQGYVLHRKFSLCIEFYESSRLCYGVALFQGIMSVHVRQCSFLL